MDAVSKSEARRRSVWLDGDAGDLDTFLAQIGTATDPADWPLAAEIVQNIPVYDGRVVARAAGEAEGRAELTAEWAALLSDGPGVLVIKGAIADTAVIDQATRVFEALIEAERAAGGGGGDHFAKPGANDRVWNAAEKHCLADPRNFAAYFATDAVALVSEAWLGPGYQVTAQVNRVNPGGAAQMPHRDYHLGFMSPAEAAAWPAHAHALSPVLTLQGAIAHCDMPVETGPTMLLPYSQILREGYLAFARPEFQAAFAERHVQVPLDKGDAVFFNPALMHGAGENKTSDIRRMANLLQVSSAFGRAIESVDRAAMARALYPVLLGARRSGDLGDRAIANIVAASAEGYAFPTDLDRNPPVGGMAPASMAKRMLAALEAGSETFEAR